MIRTPLERIEIPRIGGRARVVTGFKRVDDLPPNAYQSVIPADAQRVSLLVQMKVFFPGDAPGRVWLLPSAQLAGTGIDGIELVDDGSWMAVDVQDDYSLVIAEWFVRYVPAFTTLTENTWLTWTAQTRDTGEGK